MSSTSIDSDVAIPPPPIAAAPPAAGQLAHSWVDKVNLRAIADSVGTPVFIYSEEQLLRNGRRIMDAAAAAGLAERVELFIPFFPNSNPHVLAPLQKKLGAGLLLQLPSEYELLRRFGFDKFIVSPGHIADDEITFWARTGYPTFLSSLDEVSHLMQAGPQASVNVRLDSLGSGKPGIKFSQLEALSELLKANRRELNCFEVYCGSGNSVDGMISTLEQVFMVFKTYFPNAQSVNFAGGQGFIYEEQDEHNKHFDWGKYFQNLRQISDRFGVPGNVKFLFEPARDMLADVGALLLSVKRNLIRNPGNSQVLTDGSRALMPSAQLRGRRHNVIFLDSTMAEINARSKSDSLQAALRGRSILRHDYILPGDYWVPGRVCAQDSVLILDVGAYCATQHMEFLNIPPAAEVLIDETGLTHLITSRGDDFDKWRYLLEERKDLKAVQNCGKVDAHFHWLNMLNAGDI
jgi:diaminopimelate decarboxylase